MSRLEHLMVINNFVCDLHELIHADDVEAVGIVIVRKNDDVTTWYAADTRKSMYQLSGAAHTLCDDIQELIRNQRSSINSVIDEEDEDGEGQHC